MGTVSRTTAGSAPIASPSSAAASASEANSSCSAPVGPPMRSAPVVGGGGSGVGALAGLRPKDSPEELARVAVGQLLQELNLLGRTCRAESGPDVGLQLRLGHRGTGVRH